MAERITGRNTGRLISSPVHVLQVEHQDGCRGA
jgi:hypothetical protein